MLIRHSCEAAGLILGLDEVQLEISVDPVTDRVGGYSVPPAIERVPWVAASGMLDDLAKMHAKRQRRPTP